MGKAEGQTRKVTKRRAPARPKQLEDSPNQLGDDHGLIALKERISRLEAENKDLRRQLAAMATSANRSDQSGRDPVSEQRHNFFKYSNTQRY